MAEKKRDLSSLRTSYIFKHSAKISGEEASLAKGLPVMLKTQGLLVCMARLSRSTEKNAQKICDNLFDWLVNKHPLRNSLFGKNHDIVTLKDFLRKLEEIERPKYLALQNEAMAFSKRLKLIYSAMESKGGN